MLLSSAEREYGASQEAATCEGNRFAIFGIIIHMSSSLKEITIGRLHIALPPDVSQPVTPFDLERLAGKD